MCKVPILPLFARYLDLIVPASSLYTYFAHPLVHLFLESLGVMLAVLYLQFIRRVH